MLGAATPLTLSLFSAWVIASSFFAQLAISTAATAANTTDFKVLVNAIGMSANSCGWMYGFPRVTLPGAWGGRLLAQGTMPRESRRPRPLFDGHFRSMNYRFWLERAGWPDPKPPFRPI